MKLRLALILIGLVGVLSSLSPAHRRRQAGDGGPLPLAGRLDGDDAVGGGLPPEGSDGDEPGYGMKRQQWKETVDVAGGQSTDPISMAEDTGR